jgi:hypothetical protein
LVTPTYYVYFTSATIISGAILYQGFKGTVIEIITVVLGFFQICSGVVLLQFSKSAKDVPDTAVFTSDLDQVRQVAEQEEPEYEPRADTMRGTSVLLRAISTRRQKRETQEIARIKEEHLQPIGENVGYEYDGIRRRRTLSSPGQGSLHRRKTVHPPLGMSRFPDEEDDNDDAETDNGMHPGFWSHFKRKPVSAASAPPDVPSVQMNTFKSLPPPPNPSTPTSPSPSPGRFGHPSSLRHVHPSHDDEAYFDQDTSYQGASGSPSQHITWSPQSAAASASAPALAHGGVSPPGSPRASRARDSSKRQFSFQNVFRNRSRSREAPLPPTPEVPSRSPLARSGLSFSRRTVSSHASGVGGTEEERLGLVRGDSGTDGRTYLDRSASGSEGSPEKERGEREEGYDAGTVRRATRRRDSSEGPPQIGELKELEGGGPPGRSFI